MEFIEKMLPRMQDVLNVMDIKGLKGLGLRDLYTHETLQWPNEVINIGYKTARQQDTQSAGIIFYEDKR